MEELGECIRRYNLEEDLEHVIIPLPAPDGRSRRCFLLKRRYLRVLFPDGRYGDFLLEEVIEAIVQYPDLPLSQSIILVHREPEDTPASVVDGSHEPEAAENKENE